MNFKDMYPTDRFYAADMQGRPWTLTFADPAVTQKTDEDGKVDPKMPPIWHFIETKKVFPAVKTNGVCARAMFGDESDGWAGHKITLYPAEDTSGLSDDGLCIRVKGSPELKTKLVFKATIGRTKKTFTLVPTPARKAAPPPTEYEVDAETGEVRGEPAMDIDEEAATSPQETQPEPSAATEPSPAPDEPEGEIAAEEGTIPGIGAEAFKARAAQKKLSITQRKHLLDLKGQLDLYDAEFDALLAEYGAQTIGELSGEAAEQLLYRLQKKALA